MPLRPYAELHLQNADTMHAFHQSDIEEKLAARKKHNFTCGTALVPNQSS